MLGVGEVNEILLGIFVMSQKSLLSLSTLAHSASFTFWWYTLVVGNQMMGAFITSHELHDENGRS